jgi:GNAT superfamily N-acetyltransferase
VSGYEIRDARPGDVPQIVRMVHELAGYERSAAECTLTDDALSAGLFAAQPAVFAHVAVTGTGAYAGFSLWFLNYSTWTGTHGIYLEDLFVRPEHRGTGLGTRLLAELARLCVERGYHRLQWWVLDWNPATGFYRGMGAEAMDEWTVYRLAGRPLHALASGGDSGSAANGTTTTLT